VITLFRKKRANPRDDLKDLIGEYELPSFRSSVLGALRLLRDDDATPDQIAAQIQLDPGMHMRVLRTVNAAAFGLSTKVSSVPHAVALLGRSRLEPIVLALAVKDSLPASAASGLEIGGFWHSSSVRAMAARGFARRLHAGTQSEAFAAGLLLDMAIPVLAFVKGRLYTDAYRASMNGESLIALEKELLGYTHAMAGEIIAEAWELPEYLCAAISGHHDPAAEDVEPGVRLAALVRDQDGPEDVESIVSVASDRFGVPPDYAYSVMENAFGEAGRFATLLS